LIERVISGGQTGADRAALDWGLTRSIPIGGWIPHGRWAEDGMIPDRYEGLVETESDDPAIRTAANVRDSDATLIVSHGPLLGGSLLTLREAERQGRPVLHVDLGRVSVEEGARLVRGWLRQVNPATLNVAGPRASEDEEIAGATRAILEAGAT
jgi:hypothetical protein